MPLLEAWLLGAPRFAVDGRPVEIAAAKARALFCYLIATRQVHSRERLAGFFWPEVPERNALASLRTALYDLRRALGPSAADFVSVERNRVSIRQTANCHVDADALEAVSPEHGEPSLSAVQAAVEAYRGEFLEGLTVSDAFDFDDWVFLERERLTQLYLSALCRLGEHHARRGDYERAIEAARRVLAVDHLREDVHRALMGYCARAGHRGAALGVYRDLTELLDRELGIAPLESTTEVYRRVLADEPLEMPDVGPAPAARAAAARTAAATPPVDLLAELASPAALIGRDSDLLRLGSAWERASQGEGGLVLISGEAGIGKTRLVAELARELASAAATVLHGRSFEATASQPYAPVIDALRRTGDALDIGLLGLPEVWLRELSRLLPELGALVPDGLNEPLDGVRERDRLFEAVRVVLAAAAAERPTLLVLEDCHWADETTLNLVSFLARQLAGCRLLIVLTYRSEGLDQERRSSVLALASHGERVALAPLTASQTSELVSILSGNDAKPAAFGRRLHRVTGGNPFFLVETLRALFEQGSLSADVPGWTTAPDVDAGDYAGLPIPESVGLIVDGRLDRLSDDARTWLECASVLRSDFAFDLAHRASGLPAVAALDALDELMLQGLLREIVDKSAAGEARYDFVHALVRDRVYKSLTGARRQYVHRQVAGLLETSVPTRPGQIAYHYTRGGVRDRACGWSVRAGEEALSVYAGEAALVHFRAARELAVTQSEEYGALSGMGDAYVGLGRPVDATECYERALPLADDEEQAADLHRRIGRAFERQGAYDRALVSYGESRQLLGPGLESLSALQVADGLATVYVRLGRHAQAIGLCLDALAWLAENPRLEGTRRGEAWIRNTLGMAYLHDGNYRAAERSLERSLVLKRELGDRLGQATLLNNLGALYYHCGDDRKARDHYEASLSIKEEIGDGYGRAIALTNLALIETHLGDLGAAAEHLAAAEHGAGAVGARWLLPEIRRVAAQRALEADDPPAALAAAESALQAAEELGVPSFIGVAHRVLGMVKAAALGEAQAADEHFQTSLAVFEMLENDHELAKTHAALGEALLRQGRQADAEVHLRFAADTFETSGAHGRRSRLEPLLGE